ncbi:MFS transporter [Catellatospora tritici]|uniref:MFS transporter n=1 Tax=Catellatospora tritici TaxID=2851566 RepID=UPI001C2DC343|nr:MFS transporter [Catellatospora tritici]MBV1855598.1 MFS transporter [Catellatospora tritici]
MPQPPRVPAQTAAPARVYRTGPALALLAITQFILILDAAIVGVALPSIATDLSFTQSELSWVTNGYTLLFGGFLLLGGRLADLLGRRRLFVAGILLFTIASGAAAFAPSPAWLVVFRGLQGLTAAVVSPAALSLLLVVFPDGTDEEKAARNKALGVWGAVAGAGGAVGYILGGVLTDLLGWESVFYVNVPVGLVAAILAFRLLPVARAERRGSFDLFGAFAVTAGLILLVYVLVNAGETSWTSAQTLRLGALSLVLLLAFVLIEAKTRQPLVPLSIFRRPALRGANLVSLLLPGAFMPTFFFLALYTQLVLGFSPLVSGLALLPIAVLIVVSAMSAGKVLAKVSLRAGAAIGLIGVTLGLLWLSRVSGGNYFLQVLGPEILVGLGGGLAFVSITVAGTSSVSPEESGLASGLLNTSQQVGGALGLAVLATLAGTATADKVAAGADAATALTHGYGLALLVAAGIALVTIPLAWLLLPGPFSPPAAVPTADESLESIPAGA